MAKVEFLNPQHHADLTLDINLGAHFNDVCPMVNVTAEELPQLGLDCPVFVTKNPSTGEFELSAILGFAENENLFIEGEQWRGSYIPLDIRRQPFQACALSEGQPKQLSELGPEDELKLGLNVESNRLGKEQGQLLFDGNDEITDYVKSVSQMLGALLSGLRSTKVFLERLAQLELLSVAKLDIELGERKASFGGLYSIKPEALAELSDEDVLDFHNKGYFQACYAMMNSHGHLSKLIQWKSERM